MYKIVYIIDSVYCFSGNKYKTRKEAERAIYFILQCYQGPLTLSRELYEIVEID